MALRLDERGKLKPIKHLIPRDRKRRQYLFPEQRETDLFAVVKMVGTGAYNTVYEVVLRGKPSLTDTRHFALREFKSKGKAAEQEWGDELNINIIIAGVGVTPNWFAYGRNPRTKHLWAVTELFDVDLRTYNTDQVSHGCAKPLQTFGNACISTMPYVEQQLIEHFRRLYRLGVFTWDLQPKNVMVKIPANAAKLAQPAAYDNSDNFGNLNSHQSATTENAPIAPNSFLRLTKDGYVVPIVKLIDFDVKTTIKDVKGVKRHKPSIRGPSVDPRIHDENTWVALCMLLLASNTVEWASCRDHVMFHGQLRSMVSSGLVRKQTLVEIMQNTCTRKGRQAGEDDCVIDVFRHWRRASQFTPVEKMVDEILAPDARKLANFERSVSVNTVSISTSPVSVSDSLSKSHRFSPWQQPRRRSAPPPKDRSTTRTSDSWLHSRTRKSWSPLSDEHSRQRSRRDTKTEKRKRAKPRKRNKQSRSPSRSRSPSPSRSRPLSPLQQLRQRRLQRQQQRIPARNRRRENAKTPKRRPKGRPKQRPRPKQAQKRTPKAKAAKQRNPRRRRH